VSFLRMRFRESSYAKPAYAFYLGQRCLKGVSMCIARECVRVCVCKTMHIPPRSPVWTYQNGWPEEDGPPGERQYVYCILYIICACVCICVLKSFAARLHIICIIFRSIFSTLSLPPAQPRLNHHPKLP